MSSASGMRILDRFSGSCQIRDEKPTVKRTAFLRRKADKSRDITGDLRSANGKVTP